MDISEKRFAPIFRVKKKAKHETSMTLKIEVTFFTETSVDPQLTLRRCTLQDRTVHNYFRDVKYYFYLYIPWPAEAVMISYPQSSPIFPLDTQHQ
jgi:hypothetical protein